MSQNDVWLKRLRVGDEVAIYHARSLYGSYQIATISYETPKYLKVGGYRYRKEDGHEAGNYWSSYLVELTPELRADIADAALRRLLISKIESVRWRELPTETLQAVDAALGPKGVTNA